MEIFNKTMIGKVKHKHKYFNSKLLVYQQGNDTLCSTSMPIV